MEVVTELVIYLSAGIAMGFGAIGSGIGEGLAGGKAVEAAARQPGVQGKVMKTMLIGQAISESGGIYALVVAVLLLFTAPHEALSVGKIAALLGSGICMGFGALGPGLGIGYAASKGVEGVGRSPHNEPVIFRTMLIGQAVSGSTSIYALVVSLLLLFVIK
ncbi:MAG: ATP synthase F0 subunit C [Candidatus Mcinerneyibacterium aminivorans]|uniref:ATP synthase subunit c n=1 Tax=Candidatus Mcinerneyibacterium aminivorans TaxID=2703815 RepID=A0A5D0MIJ2_9BACT|nr:MAG: ATP synthase F0 subunit C [Candidatus Mcinerneyibacterium aminivorans]